MSNMNTAFGLVVDFTIILILIIGISLFRSPVRARAGNYMSAIALGLAAATVFIGHNLHSWPLILAALALGSGVGLWIALKVTMLQIPAMIAFQHGAGGVAVCIVSLIELTRQSTPGIDVSKVSGLLGLIIGAATFSGSMIASGKLLGVLRQKPTMLPGHGIITIIVLMGILGGSIFVSSIPAAFLAYLCLGLIALGIALGWLVSARIGGADMPVLISTLNATAGIAAAFCGVIIHNRLLVACGATVAASGSILTHVMCKAMNRSLWKVLMGLQAKAKAKAEATWLPGIEPGRSVNPMEDAAAACRQAKKVVIVPGYGMALAQAQFEVVKLSKLLEEQGKEVKFAIHPVAGRMPGHMNVLLAEADVSYDQLIEMEQINPFFKDTDFALVVGACDVVNPAAVVTEGTPITGMPILNVHEAKKVVVCNLDERPGYSGVDNILYHQPQVVLLLGDAKETIEKLHTSLAGR